MAIIAPGVARFAVNALLAGQDHVNIFDVNLSDLDIIVSRDEACFTVAGDIINNWSDHILPLLQPEYVAQSVSWIDLDSSSGSTGARTSTDGETWPQAGTQTGQCQPGNVCLRLRKVISGQRGYRAGQTRLGGMSEGYTLDGTPNTWDPAVIAAFNDAFEDFKDGINGALEGGYTANLVVVHTVDDEYVGDSNISNFSAVPTVGSQRRRLPGYGT